MTHRSDRIYLAPSEARCEPSNPCGQRSTCARYLSAIPTSGASVADYSVMKSVWMPFCAYFTRGGGKPEAKPKEVKPWPMAT